MDYVELKDIVYRKYSHFEAFLKDKLIWKGTPNIYLTYSDSYGTIEHRASTMHDMLLRKLVWDYQGHGSFPCISHNLIKVELKDTVTSLGTFLSEGTFAFGCENLEEVILSNNITSIPNQTFFYCAALKTVNIPTACTSIGRSAFAGCDSLTSITIPGSVSHIAAYAISECDTLSSIVMLGTTPPSIDISAFSHNDSLTTIYVPKGCSDAYKAASGWSDYASKIVESEE